MKKLTQEEYDKLTADTARSNHLWVNAFQLIHPTDELKQQIGEYIISLLKDKDNLLPSNGITSENQTVRELAELTPMLYVSVNAS